MFVAHHEWMRGNCAQLVIKMAADAYVLSDAPDGGVLLKPASVTQRYRPLAMRLDLRSTWFHALRHCSATELVATGVDVRTVAGRLGHSGGGTTTLKVYSAWVAEADQKAAGRMTGRMPQAPITIDPGGNPQSTVESEPSNPYQKIATDLRGAITAGVLRVGDPLPPVADLAGQYRVGTAHRAIAELKDAGFVSSSRGKRAIVACQERSATTANVVDISSRGTGA